MTDIHTVYDKLHCNFLWLSRKACAVTLTALVLLMGALHSAHAQNLVQNPNFTDGFNGYTVTGTNNRLDTQYTDAAGDSLFTVVLVAPASLSQTIATTPGVTYMVSFLGIFDPGAYTYTFGTGSLTLNGSSGCCTYGQPFTFTGTATGTSTILNFTANGGAEGFTSLDVEAAPAPLPGAGALSLIVGLAFLAVGAMRNRRNAR